MSIPNFLQDVSYDNICQEAMQALSTDIKFDKDVTISFIKIAYTYYGYWVVNMWDRKIIPKRLYTKHFVNYKT